MHHQGVAVVGAEGGTEIEEGMKWGDKLCLGLLVSSSLLGQKLEIVLGERVREAVEVDHCYML
jgi:hypothetical protein